MASQEAGNELEDLTHEQLLELVGNLRAALAEQEAAMIQQDVRIAELTSLVEAIRPGSATTTAYSWSQPLPFVSSMSTTVTYTSPISTTQTLTTSVGQFPYPLKFDPFQDNVGTPSQIPAKPRHDSVETQPLITLDDSDASSVSDSSESSSDSATFEMDSALHKLADLSVRTRCPKPEPFSLESGRSFTRFMQNFESYCSGRYSRKDKNLWTSELGKLLQGEARRMYDACGGPDQKYRKMKKALQDWHTSVKGRISSSRVSRYKNAKYQDGEGYKIFAIRLEQLYRAAYPHRKIDGKDLLRTLTTALPSTASENLERDLALVKTFTGSSNTWPHVLRLLEAQDEAIRRKAKHGGNSDHPKQHPWVSPVPHVSLSVQQMPRKEKNVARKPSKSRSPSQKLGYCTWCKKPGHHYDHCRRRLNQCLRCGSGDHRIAQCPQTGAIPKLGVAQANPRDSSSSSSDRKPKRGRSRTQKRRERVFSNSHRTSHTSLNRHPLV